MPKIIVSKYNTVRFYRYQRDFPEKYLFRYFDKYIVRDNKLSFQDSTLWRQPWQNNDIIKIQIQADIPDFKLCLYNCERKKVFESNFEERETNWKEEGMEVYESSIDLSSILEDEYYIAITYLNWPFYISDPIEVSSNFENTMFFEYSNRKNKGSVAFDTEIVFGLRCPAVLQDFQPQSDDTIYIDQNRNTTLLDSVPFSTWKLIVGDAYGVPDYIAQNLNFVFSLSDVKIDGRFFSKVDQAKFQRTGNRLYQLAGWEIEVIESEESNDLINDQINVPAVYGFDKTVYEEGGILLT
ncbi:MAG TPA: hypothetical protein VHA52_12680 [Candidatus Babeliaceae bacterium]|nr:hypothetical protein [Candidatus Babeliaceae bacterium]